MIESLSGVLPDVATVPRVFLQSGDSGSLVVIITGILGAIAVLLRAASTHFDPSWDDDEDETEVEIATGEGHGGGGGHHSSLEETVTAEVTADPGAGDIKVSRGPVSDDHGRGQKVESVNKRSATQCSHCGAVNRDSNGLCWNCGSNPDAAIKEDALSTINDRLRKSAADDSYAVRKGEEPRPYPVDTAATPQENDEFEDDKGTTEEDIRKKEAPPIWRVWTGAFLGWLQKWQMLINVHARSMLLVTLVAAVVWGSTLIYGAARFGVSGFISLLGASLIAVLSASIAALFFLVPGKRKTIGLAYPFSLNVVLLPPLIIAYYEPFLTFVWDYSSYTAIWILDNLLHYYNINSYLRQNYTMTKQGYIIMWFAISYPLGWLLGSSIYTSKTHGPSLISALRQPFTGKDDTFDSPPEDFDTDTNSGDKAGTED
ncbi:hypothetical protein [Halosimplex pelagicum]|uniref:Uncharacterized protein n=1 Tax=Halosimplex pelagicum TaxID=869886 RepID=A0A7D5TU89_9EURY|nr:hypothetical protein [Halosimplex pelagicum]QLH82114.1 hypothetical protein HZS54_11095 [Halosimplex pelagicum]